MLPDHAARADFELSAPTGGGIPSGPVDEIVDNESCCQGAHAYRGDERRVRQGVEVLPE